jgi:hypothetical protein
LGCEKAVYCFFLIFATAVWAGDFEDGVAASDKGGYKTAFSFYKKLAAQGGPYAMPLLVTICNIDSPPHLNQILGVVSVEDFDNVFGRQRIRTALSEQIKAAGGDTAVVVDTSGGGSGMAMLVGSNGQITAGPTFGKKMARW